MSFNPDEHYIDGAGFQRHKETHHLVGIEGKPHQRVAEDEEWPKWVKPHPNHIKRQAKLGGAPHTSTPGFECFVNDREGGEVTVKVHDEEEEKRALADPHAKAVDTEAESAYGG